MSFSDATLLLIGHGSTVNGDSGATVYQHAAELRRRGLFADVREAFFKIEPRIRVALAGIQTPRIFVVPFFTSEGYFTRQAIPAELDIHPGVVAHAGIFPSSRGAGGGSPQASPHVFDLGSRTLFYCQPVGTHPLMTQVILARAFEVLGTAALWDPGQPIPDPSGERNRQPTCGVSRVTPHASPSETALVIAGHGTERNSGSRKSVERQVERISSQKLFAEVHAAFLEERPRIREIPQFVSARNVVVVPFFMSDGLHVREDIPVRLGERKSVVQSRVKAGDWPWQNPTKRHGRRIFYTRGIGSEPGMAEVILERARTAAAM